MTAKPQGDSGPSAATDEATRLPRFTIGLLALLHGTIFGAAARVLPWDSASSFGLSAGLLSATHFVLLISCVFRRAWIGPAWRVVCYLSLALMSLWGYWTLSGGSYLVALYGGLGQGLAAAAAAAFAPVVLFTLPFALWGLTVTKPRAKKNSEGSLGRGLRRSAASAALVVFSCFGLARAYASAGASSRPLPQHEQSSGLDSLLERVQGAMPEFDDLALGNGGARVYVHHAFECAESLATTKLATAFVAFQDKRDAQGRLSSARCVQADPDHLLETIHTLVLAEARQATVKIDLVSGVQPMSEAHTSLNGLKLRPGLDGVCRDTACLAPWQLVAHDQFTRFVPISFIADLRVGADALHLNKIFAPGQGEASTPGETPSMSDFLRVETESFVVGRHGDVQRLVRGHPPQGVRELNAELVADAVAAAAAYIISAQAKKGRFRYKLDPYSGKQDKRSFNMPRQAGTTFALCEYGARDGKTRKAIGRSLRLMARHARKHGDDDELRLLTKSKRDKRAALGATALPLIAFARCRERIGTRHDKLMGGMARALLLMQDERGVFATSYDRKRERPVEGPETLFAEGQAIFALSMLEKIAAEDEEAALTWPELSVLHESVERSMEHYAHDYWDHPLAQFFWIEENWHCLAARASLDHHRHDAYERMCLDYNRYKLRLALDEQSAVVPEFRGAYGFGNVISPHNTATAGLGEGLAAGIEIAERRGEDSEPMRRAMKGVQHFLLAQQWRGDETFALLRTPSPLGAWSESMVSPTIRIDYVQHAMAALASGQLAIDRAESRAGI